MNNLTVSEARRLKEEAASLTKEQLRHLNKLYGWGEWLSSADKKTMVKSFVERLDRFLSAGPP